MAALTVGILTLYRFKLRMFLGPLRRQPALIALLVILAFLLLPGAFAVGYFFADLPFVAGSLVEVGAFGLSVLAAMSLLAAPGGGLMLQPAEVDFVAVAPVSVRRFVLADALFQTTAFGVGLPAVGIASLGYTLRTGAPVWAFLVPVAVLLLFLFLGILVIQVLGIARLLRRRWALPAALFLFAVLVTPAAARFVLGIPTAYANLPYPTTAAMQVALLPFGLGDWIGIPILAAFAVAVLAAHAWATRIPSLPNVRATFAAFGFSPEAKRVQQEAMLRAFGRIRRAGSTRIHRQSLRITMAVLHRVRMTRDGTLFLTAVLAVALGFPSLLAGNAFTFGGLYLVLFLPIAAVGQWLATDRPNLWIVRVAGGSPQAFFVGWWLVLAAIVGAAGATISLLAGLPAGRVDGVAVDISVAGAFGATAGSVLCAARFPYAPNEFSARPLIHFFLTSVFGGLGTIPVFAAGFVFRGSPVLVAVSIVLLVAAIGWLSLKLVEYGTRNPAP